MFMLNDIFNAGLNLKYMNYRGPGVPSDYITKFIFTVIQRVTNSCDPCYLSEVSVLVNICFSTYMRASAAFKNVLCVTFCFEGFFTKF